MIQGRVDALVASEFETLPAASFKVSTRFTSVFVDLAPVWFRCCAVMDAGTGTVHLERHLTEVPRLELVEDVFSPEPF